MGEYIHGPTTPREIARLEKQADFAAPMLLQDFEADPQMWVLDLATGVGAMARHLQSRHRGIHLVGVDLSASQLAAARTRLPEVPFVQARGERLPFRDACFDRVHCSWMLEHVPAPIAVLEEVRRILKPGGYCHFSEVDNGTFQVEPPDEQAMALMQALNEEQIRLGGDPFIGRRLAALMSEAGFVRVTVRPSEVHGSQDRPAYFQQVVEEFAEIFESAIEALGESHRDAIREVADRLRRLPSLPGARLYYQGVTAQGWR